MFGSSEVAFKFVLIATIFVLVVLASISTVNCHNVKVEEERKLQDRVESFFSSYTNTQLNTNLDSYWKTNVGIIQGKMQNELFNKLNGSFIFMGQDTLQSSDVWVLPQKDEALKPLSTASYALPNIVQSVQTTTTVTLDSIACVVPTSTYVGSDAKFACSAVGQTLKIFDSCQIRMLDAYYNVCSTCFRVNVTSSSTTSLTIDGGPAADAIYLLRPFAMSLNSSSPTAQITNIVPSVDSTSTQITAASGGLPTITLPSNGRTPATVVVYYLDYVGPIMDVVKNGVGTATILSSVDLQNQILQVSINSTSAYTIPFSSTSSSSCTSSTVATANCVQYPGLVNAAKLAKQFLGVNYNSATTISQSMAWPGNGSSPSIPFGSPSGGIGTLFSSQAASHAGNGPCAASENEANSYLPVGPYGATNPNAACFQTNVVYT